MATPREKSESRKPLQLIYAFPMEMVDLAKFYSVLNLHFNFYYGLLFLVYHNTHGQHETAADPKRQNLRLKQHRKHKQ